MPVPSAISDLSQTAGSNSPTGGESPTTADDYFRSHASFIALLRDGKGLSAEVDVASAATSDIGGANSPFVRITGTTTITSFGTNYNGPRFIRFGGALTLTHNASSLILPGGSNIATAAGDTCIAVPIGASAGWQVMSYAKSVVPSGVNSSLATSGYINLGGILVQWGTATGGQSGSSTTNNFPIAFSTACYVVIPVHIGSEASVNVVVDGATPPSTTQFGLRSSWASGTVQCLYIALGK